MTANTRKHAPWIAPPLTVGELIAKLSTLDPNLPVMLDVYGHSHKATFVGATTSRAMNESPEFGENWALIAEAAPDTEAEATPTERVDAYGRVRTEAKSDMMERAKAILARKGRVTSEDLS